MTPRPALKAKQSRPVSAIYLGSNANIANNSYTVIDLAQSPQASYTTNGTPPALPDLPELLSPGSSIGSVGSGLPSPPATNSTGSGSTGDRGSIAMRKRPISLSKPSEDDDIPASPSPSSHHSVPFASHDRTLSRSNGEASSRSNSRLAHGRGASNDYSDYEDDHNHQENTRDDGQDEENTARLDKRLSSNSKTSNENISALQRVQSLAQRNRKVLDKLSSISRLSTPSPSRQLARASPVPSYTSSTSSSRLSQHRSFRHSTGVSSQDQPLSGSETERESTSMQASTYSSHSSSSNSRNPSNSSSYYHFTSASTTFLPSHISSPSDPVPATPSPNIINRLRKTSAPDSPDTARIRSGQSTSSGMSNSSLSPSGRRRKRASMASTSYLQDFTEEDDETESYYGTTRRKFQESRRGVDVITQNALAAVASSRRSPLGARKRGPLPKEFMMDLGNGNKQTDPESGSHTSGQRPLDPVTPFRQTPSNGPRRSSTVREVRRSGPSTVDRASQSHDNPSYTGGRRQSLRAGSAESALVMHPGGRSLIGESFRAAGLSKRKEDVSPENMFAGRDRRTEWVADHTLDAGRRRAFGAPDERTRGEGVPPRAATSMAVYSYPDKNESGNEHRQDLGEGPSLRQYKSSFPLVNKDRDLFVTNREPSTSRREHVQDRAASSASYYDTQRLSQEAYTSPVDGRRFNGQTNETTSNQLTLHQKPQREHTKLMLESLTMFESSLSKIPHLGVSSSGAGGMSSRADLVFNAQNVTHAAERLNNMMRAGTSRALEAQIDAEVADNPILGREIGNVWRRVGGDYREGLRAADELVRGVTGLLLGLGKVMRDYNMARVPGDISSNTNGHGRSVSLGDEESLKIRASPDVTGSAVSGNSRRSLDSRRSWEATEDRDREREETLRRLTSGPLKADGMASMRASPVLQSLRDREAERYQETPSRGLTSNPGPQTSGSMRRLFTPREQREQQMDAAVAAANGIVPSDSQSTLRTQQYEPSPTPASRNRNVPMPGIRALPTIPKPIPTLPSEGTLRQNLPAIGSTQPLKERDRSERRKLPMASISTVRAAFPVITTPSNATTALTPHTVSNSPERMTFSLSRTASDKSTRSQVTFSRPSTVSVSTLSGLQQQDSERMRSISSSSNVEGNGEETHTSLENERGTGRRKTVGVRSGMRMSLEGSTTSRDRTNTVHPADRSAASTIQASGGRERRRTVTDIWPQPQP